jgi:uncharacterized protein
VATIDTEEPLAVAVVEAIHTGDLPALQRLLAEHPGLATARLGDDSPDGMSRTLLHVVTDWPGHFANGAATVAVLVEAGADVNARFRGPHTEPRCTGRGAQTTIDDAATLGLLDRLEQYFAGATPPGPEEVSRAFWGACHGRQQQSAAYLLDRGADVNWVPPWEELTPLDTARRSGAVELVGWLRGRGARAAVELHGS